MPYYLKHHFDPGPDCGHAALGELPEGLGGSYDLGHLPDVRVGDLLAEWVEIPPGDLRAEAGREGQIVSQDRVFPLGDNVRVDPANPGRLLAAARGYAYCRDNDICVKKTLNVRSDVDAHTGNIHFLGNVVIHGDVRSGFHVLGGNVLVRGCVDAATVRAEDSVATECGVKGGGAAVLEAGVDLRLPFAENATLLAGRNLLVDVACQHSSLYAGSQVAVRGRLVGGSTWCTRTVYVGEALGNDANVSTRIVLGYDAALVRKAHLLEIGNREAMVALENLEGCRVVVPGRVRPGVEISIGPALFQVQGEMEDVCFRYQDGEITVGSPAMKAKAPRP